MTRNQDLDRFYNILSALSDRLGGPRCLRDCHGRMGWPERGVYFFFEDGEYREDGRTPRVVRVGTHAVSAGSRTKLWQRLSQHKGNEGGGLPGGGNHRGSIFRLHVGTALLNRGEYPPEIGRTWKQGGKAPREIVEVEYPLERDVSAHIGRMPFLWLPIPDAAGRESDRSVIERNAVALLSNYGKPAVDPPSPGWLGQYAQAAEIRESGLWNVNYVDGEYEEGFLDVMEGYVMKIEAEARGSD